MADLPTYTPAEIEALQAAGRRLATTAVVAERLNVGPTQVVRYLTAGRLAAVGRLRTGTGGRPTWLFDLDNLTTTEGATRQ